MHLLTRRASAPGRSVGGSAPPVPQMSLFRRLFYRRPPDGLVEISPNILVFDHCFSTDFIEEDELKPHIGGILKQLVGHYSIDSFMVFNFEGRKKDNQTALIFSEYGMSVMGYPRNYEGCPLLTMEMIHHFLRSGESWLSLAPDNFLLIHSEQGGWPILAFALAALLVYLRRYTDERKALEMVHKQAPPELVELYSPLDPTPSQLRYLKYVSTRHIAPKLWPPNDKILNLNCVIIRKVPNFDSQGGCRPIFRIYGTNPLTPNDNSTKVLFSTPKTSDFVELYTQEDSEIIKANVRCPVQGDVVMECISLDENFEHEVMIFRIMFSTSFIEDNMLLLDRNQIDIMWDTKHRFPVEFRVEVIFSEMDVATSIQTSESEHTTNAAPEQKGLNSEHITNAASEQKGLNDEHDGFDVISLQEIEISNVIPEHRLVDITSLQVVHMENGHNHSSAPKFESERDATADAVSLPEAAKSERDATADAVPWREAESLRTNGHEHEFLKDSSAADDPVEDPAETIPNSGTPLVNNRSSEAATVAKWSETNTDTPRSDTSSSSAPSSLPIFDDDTMEAETPEALPIFDDDTMEAETPEALPIFDDDTMEAETPEALPNFDDDTMEAETPEAQADSTKLQ